MRVISILGIDNNASNSNVNFGQLRIKKSTFERFNLKDYNWGEEALGELEKSGKKYSDTINRLERKGFDVVAYLTKDQGLNFYLSEKGTMKKAHNIGKLETVECHLFPNSNIDCLTYFFVETARIACKLRKKSSALPENRPVAFSIKA